MGEAASAVGAGPPNPWKGRPHSKVKTLGHHHDRQPLAQSLLGRKRCPGCPLSHLHLHVIQGEGFRLIVDPSLSKTDEMAKELDRRTGLKLRDIDAVFVTHEHGDHWFGLAHFPEARWLAAPEVAAALNKTGKLPKPVEAMTGRLFEADRDPADPGPYDQPSQPAFRLRGLSVVIAGDAVATRDFWRERRGYFNCVDFDLSAKSMDKIAALADIVVPGHDNFFLNLSSAP